MAVELIKADMKRSVFVNLFNLYAFELSEYNPSLDGQIDENGNYLSEAVSQYIDGSGFSSYCIFNGERPIGIAVFSSEEDGGELYHDIEEIFLLKTSRHKGIAEKLCLDFWDKNSGTGTLHVLSENKTALRFWDKLLESGGYVPEKHTDSGMTVYHFPLERKKEVRNGIYH